MVYYKNFTMQYRQYNRVPYLDTVVCIF